MTLVDYYRILDLNTGTDVNGLKKAFRQKAKIFHPDVNSSSNAEEQFILIHTAYEIILAHLLGKDKFQSLRDPAAEAEAYKRKAEERARNYARMQYEKFMKECEAYHNSPYSWIFKILYYGLFYLYMFCAMIFAFVPIWAGWDGGVIYFILCLPLYVIAYFTVKMAYNWKKEIDPLFN